MSQPIYLDASQPIAARVDDLVSRMTLEEKVSQMVHEAKEIERLGIPEYNWWNECLHGVARAGLATVFPQAIGLAATFDIDLLFRVATAISDEARAKHHTAAAEGNRGQYKGLTFWTPNVNIFRDPRWGRGQETYGEDPFLTAQLGVAMVKGLQGDDPKYLKTAACAKHYAVHSGPEAERHTFDAQANPKDLFETYLPAFKALIDAGVETVMGAYNRTNGEPCCASQLLLIDILRNAWKFQGHVVSDCWAIKDIHEGHHVTSRIEESVALAVKMGCDLNCGSCFYYLEKAVEEGLIDEKFITESVKRLFATRFKLGMFDPEDAVPYTKISKEVINCETHRRLAREAAAKSIVLLKNDKGLLPLKRDYKKVLLVGPNAANVNLLLGNYYGTNDRLVTILEGLIGKSHEGMVIEYRPGCTLKGENENAVDWTAFEAKASEIVIAAFGLDPSLEGEEGDAISSHEQGDRTSVSLPASQEAYLRKLRETGTPLVLILAGGSPIAVPYDIADAILFVWYPGEEGGNAVADVLFGDVSPSGKLPLTFPKSVEQLPPYRDYDMKGRTYRYFTQEPLFPFGFGLSYTTFSYDTLMLSKDAIRAGESVDIAVNVSNRGQRDAEEVAQMYLTDMAASVDVPLYALKGFQRVMIKAGETKQLRFTITPEMMALVNEEGQSVLEPGEFTIMVGGSCPAEVSQKLGAPAPISAVFTVK